MTNFERHFLFWLKFALLGMFGVSLVCHVFYLVAA